MIHFFFKKIVIFDILSSNAIRAARLSLFLPRCFGTTCTSKCTVLVTYVIVRLSQPIHMLLHFRVFSGLIRKVGDQGQGAPSWSRVLTMRSCYGWLSAADFDTCMFVQVFTKPIKASRSSLEESSAQ